MASPNGPYTGDDMPTADEFWLAASEVISERGHLVIGFSDGSEPGRCQFAGRLPYS
jgi:hypothetical protein